MPSDKPTRPRQVTLAGWVIVVGSVLVVFYAFERVSGLHSLETREAIEEFLSEPPGDGLGLSVNGARSILRVLSLVAGAAGAAAAILGYQALSRSRSARLALTGLAVPLLVGGLATAGFVASLVVASVAMLWLQPAKDWFNGVTPQPLTETRTEQPAQRAAEAPQAWPGQPAPPATPTQPPPTVDWPAGQPAASVPKRPAALTAACVMTWVTCGLALLLMGLTVLVLVGAPDLVFDEVRRQDPDFGRGGLSEAELRRYTLIGCGVAGLWCAAGIGFAVAAFQGLRWGWRALVISTAIASAASALLILGNPVMVVPLAASAVTVGLLVRPETRAWCRRTARGRGSVSS
jgi:hypothetical protein